MKYTVKNNLEISKMTLGTVQLGMNYGVNNSNGMPSEEDSFAILDAAYEGGVTFLDTSDDYGKSEEVIGKYIKNNPDKKFNICTKFNVKDVAPEDVYKTLKDFALLSCKKLSIDCIPIFMSHSEKNFIDYGKHLTDALAQLKKDGIIKCAAISMSRKDAINDIIECGGFDAIQLPLNILDNKEIINGTIKKMHDAGMAVFIRSVYLQGLFFRKPEQLADSKLKIAIPYIEKVNEIAKKENMSVAQLALSYIRDTVGVDSLVVGSETPAQVKENIKMFDTPTLSQETIDYINEQFKDVDPFVISPWEWAK